MTAFAMRTEIGLREDRRVIAVIATQYAPLVPTPYSPRPG